MKIQVSRKNRELILSTTKDNILLLVKLVKFLLDLRKLDRRGFIKDMTKLIIDTVLLIPSLKVTEYLPGYFPAVT